MDFGATVGASLKEFKMLNGRSGEYFGYSIASRTVNISNKLKRIGNTSKRY